MSLILSISSCSISFPVAGSPLTDSAAPVTEEVFDDGKASQQGSETWRF